MKQLVTFNNLIVNAFFTRDYHVKMLVAFLEPFRLRLNTTVAIKHSKQAVLSIAA